MIIYCDGGSRGNPGPAASAFVVTEDGKTIFKDSKFLGVETNNVAEYQALIKALELACKFTKDEITCNLDSELVVKQLLGEYKVRNPKLLPLFLKVQKLQENFKKIIYKHVSRWDKFQKIADPYIRARFDDIRLRFSFQNVNDFNYRKIKNTLS